MTLQVEDGTGLPDAESYVDLDYFKTFCMNRGYDFSGHDDFQLEASLRMATGFIDTYARYKGQRSLTSQSLEFPRINLVDWSSLPVTGVPLRVKQACCELAFKGLDEPLYQDQDRGGKTISESVGPISVTFAADAPTGKVWQFAVKLLAPYIRDPSVINGPQWAAPNDATTTTPQHDTLFDIGMFDNPSVGMTSVQDTQDW